MESICQCPSCKQLYTTDQSQPIILSCNHNMCLKCYEEQYNSQAKVVCSVQNCFKETLTNPNIVQFNTELLQKIVLNQQNSKCFQHLQTSLKCCLDDEMLLCEECLLSHQDHNIKINYDAQKELNEEIPQLLQILKSKTQLINQNCGVINASKSYLYSKIQQFQNFIQSEADKSIEMICKQRDSYFKEIQKMTKKLDEEIRIRSERWQEIQDIYLKESKAPPDLLEAIKLNTKIQDVQNWAKGQIQDENSQKLGQLDLNQYNISSINFKIDFKKFYETVIEIIQHQIKDNVLLFAVNNSTEVIRYDLQKLKKEELKFQTQNFSGFFKAIQIDWDTLVVTGGFDKND